MPRRAVSCAAGTVLVLLLGQAPGAQASTLDGSWLGETRTQAGSCNGFDIAITVNKFEVAGEVITPNHKLNITGRVTKDGLFLGEVTKIGFTVAELRGTVTGAAAAGTWRMIRGKDCSGTFTVRKLS